MADESVYLLFLSFERMAVEEVVAGWTAFVFSFTLHLSSLKFQIFTGLIMRVL